jgi:hypothetical protein
MRTTLTIDDDLAGMLRQLARQLDKPFREVVNTTLRKGLAAQHAVSTHQVVVRPHDFGASRGTDLDRLNQLVDELDAEKYLSADLSTPRHAE